MALPRRLKPAIRSTMLVLAILPPLSSAAQDTPISIERGDRVARIGGCHDCHTAGFSEANGVLDLDLALKGNSVGYRGPWGTTFPANLRIVARNYSEEEFAKYLSSFEANPPMPWFNVHFFEEAELRSLHQYLISLGEPGEPAPDYVPPGEEPINPYIVFAPPTLPAQ